MAEKKKATKPKATKPKIGKPPTLAEKITDFSTGAMTNIRFVPKKK